MQTSLHVGSGTIHTALLSSFILTPILYIKKLKIRKVLYLFGSSMIGKWQNQNVKPYLIKIMLFPPHWCWFAKQSPTQRARKRPKKEAGHSRLIGGRCNKQENSHGRLVLGGHKTSRSLNPPERTCKGLNWGQSCIPSRWFQKHITL